MKKTLINEKMFFCGDLNGKEIQRRGDVYVYVYVYVYVLLIHFAVQKKLTL